MQRYASMVKLNADIYVKDVPGTLVASLEPISTFNGNIVGVFHNREQVISGRILVNVTFSIDQENLELLKKEWQARDVIVAKLGEDFEIFSMDYMLVGNLDAIFIETLIDKINGLVKVVSVEIGYSSNINKGSRAAMISVNLQSKDDRDKLDKFISEEADRQKLILVKGVVR